MTEADDAVFSYLTGQRHPDHPALVEGFEREGREAVAALHPALDIAYGSHPRERFDLFTAKDARATLLYLHAGYWQSRDKAQFRFLAPVFVQGGLNLAVANYPLCPEVGLAALTESVRRAVPAVLDAMAGPTRLIAIGHSAGGHLAVELGLSDWTGRGFDRSPIAGVVGLSGVYDLEPLLDTALNDNLRLDRAAARAASPVHRVRDGLPPALFAVGGRETAAFQRQTDAMRAAWAQAGARAQAVKVEGADHFTLLRAASDPEAPLFRAILRLAVGES
jgi:arylformamidase